MIPFDMHMVGEDCLAICKSKWSRELDSSPFTWEIGMRVVDRFGAIVHIKEILKPKSTLVSKFSEWIILVEESDNQYRYTELSGEFVALVFKNQFEKFIKENELIDVIG